MGGVGGGGSSATQKFLAHTATYRDYISTVLKTMPFQYHERVLPSPNIYWIQKEHNKMLWMNELRLNIQTYEGVKTFSTMVEGRCFLYVLKNLGNFLFTSW